MKRLNLILVALVIVAANIVQASERPRIVIYISIDQMKAEYLQGYKAEYTGGFKRLLSEGINYSNADLNYSPSETGPGHASLGTGSYPMHSGITENSAIDPASGKNMYCVEDTNARPVDGYGGGSSPLNLMVTGLGDWWKKAYPAAKVISASIKDRAAILMSGRHPDQAYWYDRKSGRMVTSDHYMRHLPEWVKQFNEQDWVSAHMPDSWTKLLPDSVYTHYGPDEMAGEPQTNGSTSFPHDYKPEKKKEQVASGPFGDAMVLDFARAAINSEKLGQRGVTDLLILSLSCTDYVGHAYGPNSHEMIDQIIRLDRELGRFFSEVEGDLGKGSVLVALSADHAALPLPEYLSSVEHITARRIMVRTAINPKIDQLDSTLQAEWKISGPIIRSRAFLNYAIAAKAGIDSVSLESRIRDGMRKIDGIAEVYFRRDIVNPANAQTLLLGYLQRGFYPSRGKDFMILPCEYCLLTNSATGTSHGTPYRYDTHVPILFWGNNVAARTVGRTVHTVDIAPTIAKYFGVAFPATIDGGPLKEIVP